VAAGRPARRGAGGPRRAPAATRSPRRAGPCAGPRREAGRSSRALLRPRDRKPVTAEALVPQKTRDTDDRRRRNACRLAYLAIGKRALGEQARDVPAFAERADF